MADFTFANVEVAAMTQGVAFLYAQAGELLKRRRQAKDRAEAAVTQQAGGEARLPLSDPLPPLEPPEGVFEPAANAIVHPAPAIVDRLSDSLLEARRDVDDYVVGTAALDPRSLATVQAVDRLRRLLEEVYGAVLTFKGEQRVAAGDVTTRVDAQQIGVSIAGNVTVTGDIAGHTINKRR